MEKVSVSTRNIAWQIPIADSTQIELYWVIYTSQAANFKKLIRNRASRCLKASVLEAIALDSRPTSMEFIMSQAMRASDTPYAIEVTQGKDYWWCSCGQSKGQPFCDGSHKTEAKFTPIKYTALESKTVYFCGCKASANQPLCDGAHKKPV
jgi:CDGSH iron-sulfur domain-containing protein 3